MTVAQTLYITEPGDQSDVSINDINQGWLGDCFICAPLAGLALERPDFVHNMIRDNGDGTQNVHIYLGTNWNNPGNAYYIDGAPLPTIPVASDGFAWITVKDSDLGRGMNTNNGGQLIVNGVQEIWPQVVENALVQVNGGYTAVNYGGDPNLIMKELTGISPQVQYMDGMNSNHSVPNAPTAASLIADLAAHDIVYATTYSGGMYSLVANHVYTLTSVTTGQDGVSYASFRNPWGYGDPAPIPVSDLSNAFGSIGVDVLPAANSTPVAPAPAPVPAPLHSLDFSDRDNHHFTTNSIVQGSTLYTAKTTGLDGAVTQSVGNNGVDTLSTPLFGVVSSVVIQDNTGESYSTNAISLVQATLSNAKAGSLLLTNAQHGNIQLDSGNYNVTINAHSTQADTVGVHNNDFIITAGSGDDTIILRGAGTLTHGVFTSGSGHDVFMGANGGNQVTFGSGRVEVTGGSGADNYIYHAGSGVDIIQNFDSVHDTLNIDQALKSSMKVSHGAEGTTLMFGSSQHELVLHAVQNFDSGLIHWN